MTKKLIAVLACRNNSSRLYGKPMQLIDIKNKKSILDYLIQNLKKINCIDKIVLGISTEIDSYFYLKYAKKNKLGYVFGDEVNVLSRLVKAGIKYRASDILRITSECPFPYIFDLEKNWKIHKDMDFDASFLDNIIDGSGYEIISLESLQKSNKFGKKKHKSEACTLFLRENKKDFKINLLLEKNFLINNNLRLTVDYPEDLIVCRNLFEKFFKKKTYDEKNYKKMIDHFSKNKYLIGLIKPFCASGYKKMYK